MKKKISVFFREKAPSNFLSAEKLNRFVFGRAKDKCEKGQLAFTENQPRLVNSGEKILLETNVVYCCGDNFEILRHIFSKQA